VNDSAMNAQMQQEEHQQSMDHAEDAAAMKKESSDES